ncbi:hypothetical protein KDA_71500 [Dictyobacter alpinus]|uniref:DUF1326 domain-containing protein n=1 Tax=Dictyobacter alpinus TaxID=2014873 RepID=A0A402BK04_9CHLR|nr:DUF1326 domain-containing protein [Dictyobacter alpinus]GCE31666.1 hypothetical protein KDA_71500 [Dictyobacter alpinus]
MITVIQQKYLLQGAVFGARGDSCSCNPCDCNPCKCADGVRGNDGLSYPLWRVSGYYIETGTIQDIEVSDLSIMSLTQPVSVESNELWQEIFLIDARATSEQASALLSMFERQLDSVPAEVAPLPHTQRAVYRAQLAYHPAAEGNPTLHATFRPDQPSLLRASSDPQAYQARAWDYDGPMALRNTFTFKKM